MHAAPSVILFTVLSGAGFGFLAFLGLGMPAATGWAAFAQFFIAFALAVGGLLASTFHLGNPQRALKAFSQWRTSWLSREGVISVATLCLIGIYAALVIFFARPLPVLGVIGTALSLLTVFATSMIYTQMRTVPRWNTALTPVYFLAAAIAGGAILSGQGRLAALFLLVLGALQIVVWFYGDGRFAARGHTIAQATGLGGLGKLRQFESPHTGSNYLLKEFVHQVGRRHAIKLRAIGLVTMSLLPALLLLIWPTAMPVLVLAFLLHLIGMSISRWLFFSEAEHVTRLFYGRE